MVSESGDALRDQLQVSLGAAYVLDRELGGGGMSRVFLAEEVRFRRTVVVKVLAPQLAAALSAERFEREISLAAALQEPHIVPVLTAGALADGLPYYTMPYVRGESLRARLAAGAVPLTEAVSVLRDVAKALGYAHAHGIVHRDVKPENVLLSNGTAVVTDFGIAKAIHAARTRAGTPEDPRTEALTSLGMSLGTPAYMPPEQAAGDDVDHRADIYAWGVIAYELLSGRHPFANRTTAQQLIAAHIAEVPTSLRAIAPTVPAPLAALVMRCLAKNPAARPASAVELLTMLDNSSAATSGVSRKYIVAAAGVALFALVGAGLFWRSRGSHTLDVAPPATTGPIWLAVLPFEHQGPPEQAMFADGLTDAVTGKLGALPALAVIDRRSAGQYRASAKTARQIGTELGVRFLVMGVVRWARMPEGVWRAQVTPTLVDATNGATRWTGEPEVITLTDPFTAQGQIAAHVARALAIALQPSDEARLRRRMTDSPEAFAAYQRGMALQDAVGKTPDSPTYRRRVAAEFELAVALDSTYGDAWGRLALSRMAIAYWSPGDRVAERRMGTTLAQAVSHARENALVMITQGYVRASYDRTSTGVDSLIGRAVATAPGDAAILALSAETLDLRGHADSAYALFRRAALLDPRSAITLFGASGSAWRLRRWSESRQYADAMLALDSIDERAFGQRLMVERLRGDTMALTREIERALARVPRPSNQVLQYMVGANGEYPVRYLSLSARALGISSFFDSVSNYLDLKADASLRRGDATRARVYYDSIRTLVSADRINGGFALSLLSARAVAEASLGDQTAARRTMAELRVVAKPFSQRTDLADVLDPVAMAAVSARLGDPEAAVRSLEAGLNAPTGWTAPGYRVHPKLLILRDTPAFKRFLSAHAE